jgi:hypothetical protein
MAAAARNGYRRNNGCSACNLHSGLKERIAAIERLHDYQMKDFDRLFQVQLEAMGKLITANVKELETRTETAKKELDIHLEILNKSKEALKEQAALYITRIEYDAEHRHLGTDVKALREWQVGMQAVATQKSVNISYVLSIIAILVAIISLVLKFHGGGIIQ